MAGHARLLVGVAAVGTALYAAAGCAWSLEGFTGGAEPDAAPSADAMVSGDASTDAGTADGAAGAVSLSIDPLATGSAGTFDLTALGPLDWAQFTQTGTTRCAPCAPRIAMLGLPAQTFAYNDDPRRFTWSNGTPVATGSTTEGVFIEGVGHSLDLRVSAAPTRAVLTLHVATFYTAATLGAEIVGAVVAPQELPVPAVDSGPYTIKVRFSGPAGSSLHLTWTMTAADVPPDPGEMPNIAIIAATLAAE